MERCPYCGQPITHKKLEQIKMQIRRELTQAAKGERKKIEWEWKAKERELQLKESELRRKYQEQRSRDMEKLQKQLEAERETGMYRGRMESERERAGLRKQLEELQRKLEKEQPEERGSISEENLLETLHENFPEDTLERVPKGESGADIKHTIKYHGEPCGMIVYESKNVKNWQNAFLTKAQQYRSLYSTPHIILATTAFPEGEKGFAIKKGIIIISHDKVPYIASLLRTSIIDLREQKLSEEEKGTKMFELYEYLKSPDFGQKMQAISESIDRLRELQSKEKHTHERTWAQQEAEHKEVVTNANKISAKIATVLRSSLLSIRIKSKRKVPLLRTR